MSEFLERVQQGEIPQPTQQSFSEELWEDGFAAVDEPSEDDRRVFRAGMWFFEQFEEIRRFLSSKELTQLSRGDLVRLYCGIANHEFLCLEDEANLLERKLTDRGLAFVKEELQNHKITNVAGFEVGLPEAADASVDSVELPIRYSQRFHSCTSSALGPEDLVPSDVVMAKIAGEIYSTLEVLWQECLWNGWEVVRDRDINVICSPVDDVDISRAVSTDRFHRLRSEFSSRLASVLDRLPQSQQLDRWEVSIDESAEAPCYALQRRKEARDKFDHRLLSLEAKKLHLVEVFKEPLSEVEGVSVDILLDVWQVLSALAEALLEKIDSATFQRRKAAENEDEIQENAYATIDEMAKYAPFISDTAASQLIREATDLSQAEAKAVLEFLVFDGDQGKTLWDAPLVRIEDGKLVPLLMPMLSPFLLRISQVWARRGGAKLDEKGAAFEREAQDAVARSIEKSSKIKDLEVYQSNFSFEVGGATEEIDLVIRLGHKILVGEAKCQIVPLEGLDFYNYYSRLEKAAVQAQRKAAHLDRDSERFIVESGMFSSEGCPHDAGDLKFIPFVLSNLAIGAGWVSNGVPVVDLFILLRYLDRGRCHFFSIMGKGGQEKPLFVERFYRDEREAIDSIDSYLEDPPQVRLLEGFLDYYYQPLLSPTEEKTLVVAQLKLEMDPEMLKSVISKPK